MSGRSSKRIRDFWLRVARRTKRAFHSFIYFYFDGFFFFGEFSSSSLPTLLSLCKTRNLTHRAEHEREVQPRDPERRQRRPEDPRLDPVEHRDDPRTSSIEPQFFVSQPSS